MPGGSTRWRRPGVACGAWRWGPRQRFCGVPAPVVGWSGGANMPLAPAEARPRRTLAQRGVRSTQVPPGMGRGARARIERQVGALRCWRNPLQRHLRGTHAVPAACSDARQSFWCARLVPGHSARLPVEAFTGPEPAHRSFLSPCNDDRLCRTRLSQAPGLAHRWFRSLPPHPTRHVGLMRVERVVPYPIPRLAATWAIGVGADRTKLSPRRDAIR